MSYRDCHSICYRGCDHGCWRLQPCAGRRVVAVVDLEDDADDLEALGGGGGGGGGGSDGGGGGGGGAAHGEPQLLTAKATEALTAAEVSARLSAIPFLRERISPHEMDDDALLSRTAALGLIACAHFGRDGSYGVRLSLGQ